MKGLKYLKTCCDDVVENDEVIELSCNLDDMTPEDIGYAQEKLLANGALDVYTINIGMKKTRPGIMLNCLCNVADRDAMVREIFKHTTTIGLRECRFYRHKLVRTEATAQTPCGEVRTKQVSGCGIERSKLEYDDIKKIADEHNISLAQVRELLAHHTKKI